MKKYKLKPINGYYYYKKRKLTVKRIFLTLLIFSFIGVSFIGVGYFKENFQRSNWFRQDQSTSEMAEVYLNSSQIRYDLYRVPKVVKGIYIPQNKVDDYETYITLTKNTSVNSFVIDVKNDYGYLTFNTSNARLVEMGCVSSNPPIADIRKVMSRLYEEDIYPIARIVVFKDSIVPKKFPERAVKDLKGGVYTNSGGDTWLDPYNKDNWEYILEISKEAINVGFKEIQFDYIRFHESMDENRVQLRAETSKSEIITAFTKYMYENLKSYGIYVSGDVFGAVIMSNIDQEIVGQDFKEMSKYLDYICPMVYPSHYATGTFGIEYPHLDAYGIILRSMELAQDEMKKNERDERRAIIRPWLQDFTMTKLKPYQVYGEEQIRAQIKGTYDAGLDEWLFWNASGKYTEAGLKDK